MMIFTSLYSVVDGFFIANYAGRDSYAGINLIMPVIMIIGGIGFMYGTGGSALSAKLLGEKKDREASEVFSLMLLFTVISGIIISVIGFIFIKPIAVSMASFSEGTTDAMINEAVLYGRILVLGQVGFMTQNLFQSFFLVAERSKTGFLFTVLAGITNMILDALFIGIFRWGVAGAAAATITGYIVGSAGPVLYFLKHKDLTIGIVKPDFRIKPILKSCANGSSEFVSNVSSSIVGIVFNIQLLKYIGQDGVSAYGTIMYVGFIFVAVFIGYSIGISPVISYNFGAQNHAELKNVLKKSTVIILCSSVIMALLSFLGADFLGTMFSSGDPSLASLSGTALRINSACFIFCGLAIFISSFFTALNNGLLSAVQSFLRTIVFQIGFVFLLPAIIGQNGIWWACVGSDISSMTIGLILLAANRKKYRY